MSHNLPLIEYLSVCIGFILHRRYKVLSAKAQSAYSMQASRYSRNLIFFILCPFFIRRFNSEVQHLGEQEGRCYPKWLCQKENMFTCLCLKETLPRVQVCNLNPIIHKWDYEYSGSIYKIEPAKDEIASLSLAMTTSIRYPSTDLNISSILSLSSTEK